MCQLQWTFAAIVLLNAAPQTTLAADAPPYRIVDGKVDDATYRGWLAYHSACHTCHGVDGIGTAVAPSLVDRVKDLRPTQFAAKVITSYRIVIQSGELSGDDNTAIRQRFAEEVMREERAAQGELLMPAWEQDEKIRPRVLDLYAYLRARAAGALGPGRPQRMKAPAAKSE